MDKRYKVINTFICPMNFIMDFVKPNLEFPTRMCVLDTKENFIIDIEHELMYKFIKTNREYSLCVGEKAKIEEGKRFGIFTIETFDFSNEMINKAEKIIGNLEKGFIYPNGNEVLNNKEYFSLVSNDENKEMSNKKVQKIIKRKKN